MVLQFISRIKSRSLFISLGGNAKPQSGCSSWRLTPKSSMDLPFKRILLFSTSIFAKGKNKTGGSLPPLRCHSSLFILHFSFFTLHSPLPVGMRYDQANACSVERGTPPKADGRGRPSLQIIFRLSRSPNRKTNNKKASAQAAKRNRADAL